MTDSTTQKDGFFSIEQIDRMNLKTLSNELPQGYDGQQLMALLTTKVYDKTRLEELSHAEATQAVVDWYCATTAEDVARAINVYGGCTEYQSRLQVLNFLHTAPADEVEKFMEFVDSTHDS